MLEWVAISDSRGSSRPRDLGSPALQEDSLPAEPPGKSPITGLVSLDMSALEPKRMRPVQLPVQPKGGKAAGVSERRPKETGFWG